MVSHDLRDAKTKTSGWRVMVRVPRRVTKFVSPGAVVGAVL
jgi:hypothetical protein